MYAAADGMLWFVDLQTQTQVMPASQVISQEFA